MNDFSPCFPNITAGSLSPLTGDSINPQSAISGLDEATLPAAVDSVSLAEPGRIADARPAPVLSDLFSDITGVKFLNREQYRFVDETLWQMASQRARLDSKDERAASIPVDARAFVAINSALRNIGFHGQLAKVQRRRLNLSYIVCYSTSLLMELDKEKAAGR